MSHDTRKRSLEELPQVLRAFLSASDAFDEALAKVLELNATDVRCVNLLDQYGTMTAGALAGVAGLSTGAVTFLLDRLEDAGFVRRLRTRKTVGAFSSSLSHTPGLGSPSCARVLPNRGGRPRDTFRRPISRGSSPSCEKGRSSTKPKFRSCARRSPQAAPGVLLRAERRSKRP